MNLNSNSSCGCGKSDSDKSTCRRFNTGYRDSTDAALGTAI